MDSRRTMILAIFFGLLIVAVSLIISYISFSILESSAEATLKNWKLGGAFAAFVFTATLLTSIVFQFYKQLTSDKIETYKKQIQELQTKLVKGASCPIDYIIDLDEKHKIVFSRPNDWHPKGGVLYQYVKKQPSKIFKTNFNVVHYANDELNEVYNILNLGYFDSKQIDTEKLYEAFSNSEVSSVKVALKAEDLNLSKEYIFIDNIKSLKFTMTYTGQAQDKKIKLCQTGIVTYVPRLFALFNFTFSDSAETYMKSSETFNNVITSIRFL